MLETPVKKPALFEDDKMSAIEAISRAQFIAFAPYVFQASTLLRDKGILKFAEETRLEGITLEALAEKTGMSYYAVRVLVEAGLGIKMLYQRDNVYMLTKLGHFYLNDKMTRVNADFMRDVCYDGAQDLEASLEAGKPKGLRHLGPWETIYEGLSILPQPANDSWFSFDHFYSDTAFPEALPVVFASKPKKLLDIGSNTGKWTMQCLNFDHDVQVGMVDLPIQFGIAKKNIEEAGLTDRVTYHPQNVLSTETELPTGYDIIWMSQFLDCFADDEIVFILEKCHRALDADGRVFINETFWDRQRFEASAFSLQMTSLYFTTIANGNSQMYDSRVFNELVKKAGFQIVNQTDNIGRSHTILELKKV